MICNSVLGFQHFLCLLKFLIKKESNRGCFLRVQKSNILGSFQDSPKRQSTDLFSPAFPFTKEMVLALTLTSSPFSSSCRLTFPLYAESEIIIPTLCHINKISYFKPVVLNLDFTLKLCVFNTSSSDQLNQNL